VKEVITVELDRADVEAAIEDFLNERGYKVEGFKFKINSSFINVGNELEGASVTVSKLTGKEE
jgi:hypothetical protein